MRRLFASILLVCLIAAVVAATPANPVGTWKGGFRGGRAKLPGRLTPDSKKALDLYMEMLKSMRVALRIKANHTFVIDISGTANGKRKTSRTEGKWKLSGATVTTRSLQRDGKALSAQEQTVNELVLGKDGNTLTRAYDQGPVLGKIVLKRV